MKNFHIIVNLHAGSGTSKAAFKQIEQKMNELELPYQVYETTYAGHAVELAKELGNQEQLDFANQHVLLVIGGDGTLHEVINGLSSLQKKIPIAYIPCGSGNDFARGVGISRTPLKALGQILQTKETKRFDIVAFNEDKQIVSGYLVNNYGIGFDAAVVKKTNHSNNKVLLNKFKLGSLSYLSSVISVFFKLKAFPITVTVDGKEKKFEEAFLVTLGNHPYFGGGVPIIPMANPTDEKVDLIVVTKINFLQFLFLFFMMLFKKHTAFKAVHLFHGKNIRLEVPVPEDGQADGEEMGTHPYDIHFETSSQEFWF